MDIVRDIERYLTKHNMSKMALARKIGTSHNQIYRWLSGQHKPSPMAMKVLIDHNVIQQKSRVRLVDIIEADRSGNKSEKKRLLNLAIEQRFGKDNGER